MKLKMLQAWQVLHASFMGDKKKKKTLPPFERFGNQHGMKSNENVFPPEKPWRTPCNVIVAN